MCLLLFLFSLEGFIGDIALPNVRNEIEYELQMRRDEEQLLMEAQMLNSSSSSSLSDLMSPLLKQSRRRRRQHQRQGRRKLHNATQASFPSVTE